MEHPRKQKKYSMPSYPTLSERVPLRSTAICQIVLLIFTVILLFNSFTPAPHQPEAFAQTVIPAGYTCNWYRIAAGDTLDRLAVYHHVNVFTLARINHIPNLNLIFSGQRLCIPYAIKGGNREPSGILNNGAVRWYAYDALERSSPPQVVNLLRQAALRHGLPPTLMLAIAWQESGWKQHLIARDGGIGAMQIMPYTAQGLNNMVSARYDPYKLDDNIEMGAIYLQALHRSFGGDLIKIISAYNEGGWNVRHRGIYNWAYVRNVRALMSRY